MFYGSSGGEAQAMEGRDVYIAGAGNSAATTALYLARYARRVTLLARGGNLARSMSEYLIREIRATSNLAVRLCTQVVSVHGNGHRCPKAKPSMTRRTIGPRTSRPTRCSC